MSKVLITGGCGYIGSHVTLALIRHNHEMVVVDNLSTGDVRNLAPNVAFEQGDIGDQLFLEKLFTTHKIDSIIHLAAKTDVEESIDNPLFYYQENTFKTAILIEAAAKHGISKIIFSSTAAVYKNSTNELINETWPTEPINPYGRSKLFAEHILKDFTVKNNIQCIVLRYFNVAGIDESFAIGNRKTKITTLIQKLAKNIAEKNLSIDIFGNDYSTPDKTCIRDFIHVSDIAEAHVLALDKLQQRQNFFDIYNVGYGAGLSVLNIIDLFEKTSGITITRNFKNRRPDDIERSIADPKKIITTLGWKPKYKNNIEQLIQSELIWQKKLADYPNERT